MVCPKDQPLIFYRMDTQQSFFVSFLCLCERYVRAMLIVLSALFTA